MKFAITLLATITSSVALLAADNSLGTWKRDIEKSKSSATTSNPIKSLTVVNEPWDGGVRVTTSGERMDGTSIRSSYTVKYDGKEYPSRALVGTRSQ